MQKSAFLPIGCFVFLLTIGALSLGFQKYLWIPWLATFVVFIFKKNKSFKQFALVSVLAGVAGLGSFYQINQNVDSYSVYESDQPVEFVAYIQAQEVRSTYKQRLTVIIRTIEAHPELAGETIMINTNRFPAAAKGDIVSVSCRFELPQPFDGFAYDRYLASQDIFLLCQDAKFEIIDHQRSLTKQPLEYGRIVIAETINELWPRPVSSLVAGLLLGTRESFPEKTLLDFRRAGVTHIIALSGFNITILIVFLEMLAVRLLIPVRIRLGLIFGGIILFTIFVGAGASIVRAAIMGSLVLLCKHVARDVSPIRLMVITAAVMTVLQPYILVYDVGFQLSFLSTLGLLYLTPLFERLFGWMPKFFGLRESMTTTMAATTGTLPLILYQFGQLSIVSPLANMLVLPLIPWLMALGALSVILTWITPVISGPIVYLVDLGCQYMLNVSKITASWSWAAVPMEIPLVGMILGYLFIIYAMRYGGKNQTKSA